MAASVLVVVGGSAFLVPAGACASRTVMDRDITVASVAAPAIHSIRLRMCITPLSPRRTIRRVVKTERRVHHLFDERHAVELEQLGVGLEAAVQDRKSGV